MPNGILNQSDATHSVAPLDSREAFRNLNQIVTVQVVEVVQRAVRLVVPRHYVKHRLFFEQPFIAREDRLPLPPLKAPPRWLNRPGTTLVQQGINQFSEQDLSGKLPRLQSPAINQQWIDIVNAPNYKGGF